MKSFVTATVILCALAGCATPHVVSTRKAGDADLTCPQLKNEYADAVDFESKARGERKVTGTNVAAAVLFWPALIGTYANTEEAITAAKDRQKRIEGLAQEKNCKL